MTGPTSSPPPRHVDGPLDAAAAEQVRALADQARAADGVEALGEQTLLNLVAPGAPVVHLLLDAPQGVDAPGRGLAGYAQVETGPGTTATAELVVRPDLRGRGRGRALLDAVLGVAARSGTEPAVWAHGDLPGARTLAAGAGLLLRRELWQMAADLTGPDAATGAGDAPDVPGVVVRPFVVGQDEDAWLRVNARAFADHPEQGRMTLADLRAREAEPWFAAQDLLLAERDGKLLASVWIKVEPGPTSDAPAETGELYVLGVDPDEQGRGLGRLLTSLTLDHLRARGARRVMLYVSPGDVAAVRTYRSAGFTTSRVDVQYGPPPRADAAEAGPAAG